MYKQRFFGALAVIAGCVAIAVSGAASTGLAAPASKPKPLDATSPASISAYLAAKGVDLTTVVWQTGLQNYAGPNCPGIGWTCTTSSNVIQIAQAGGQNRFSCDPAFFAGGDDPPFPVPPGVGTDAALGVCVIVQISPSGQNHARCFERSTTTPKAALSCIVYQQNGSGSNFLQIHQRVQQSSGAVQDAELDVDVVQHNEAGSNYAHVVQQAHQSTSEVDAGSQEQSATFDIEPMDQVTETGNNHLTLSQHLHQNGTATGPPTIQQSQFSDQRGRVDQFANAGGFSQAFAHQSEHQHLTGPGSQTQIGPQGCCGAGTQVGDPAQTLMNILQQSTQSAAGGTSQQQSQSLEGSCNSTGTCAIAHHAANDEASASEKVTGTGVTFLTTTCFSAQSQDDTGEGSCATVEAPPEDID